MSTFEVPTPILNSPFEEPKEHWWILEGQPAERRTGRRPAMYHYIEPGKERNAGGGFHIELKRVNLIRERVKAWRGAGWPGVTRTTSDLLAYWRREDREHKLFFAQLEAAETIIFLAEARADFRQGVEVPRDEPSDEEKARGYAGFVRYACKMATGSGKTTVMGMLAAWSILNKATNRGDKRFSDVVLVVCPNVTIRDRLRELDPDQGEASLYRTRDLVPERQMPQLRQGRIVVTNWHVLEPRAPPAGGFGGEGGEGRRAGTDHRDGPHRRPERHQAGHALADPRDAAAAGGERLGGGRRGKPRDRRGTQGAQRAVCRERRLARAARPARGGRQAERPGLQRRGPPCLPGQGGAARGLGGDGRVRARGMALGQDRGDGVGGRVGPHPQGSRHQRLHRFVRDTLLPQPRGPGGQPPVPVGGQRLRADRRDRERAGQDSAACRARLHGQRDSGVFQHLAVDSPAGSVDGLGAWRETGESQAGGHPEVGSPPHRDAGRPVGRDLEPVAGRPTRGAAPRLHPGVQEHGAGQRRLRVACPRQGAGRHPVGETRRIPQHGSGKPAPSSSTRRSCRRPTRTPRKATNPAGCA